MMHHNYLPVCYVERIDVRKASSTIYDARRLMEWLIDCDVKLLLHGHKHQSFVSQIRCPKNQDKGSITSEDMRTVTVVGMGSTGEKTAVNEFATIFFEETMVIINFYKIFADESEKDRLYKTVKLPL